MAAVVDPIVPGSISRRKLLTASVSCICSEAGFNSVEESAIETLTEMTASCNNSTQSFTLLNSTFNINHIYISFQFWQSWVTVPESTASSPPEWSPWSGTSSWPSSPWASPTSPWNPTPSVHAGSCYPLPPRGSPRNPLESSRRGRRGLTRATFLTTSQVSLMLTPTSKRP